VLLEVRDNGIGIERKNLKRVFHRFYRVEDEEVRERRGTGLGLFVVWALVKQLGGKVQAMSEGRGRGTTMRVELPVAPALTS
jgi:signal transduction histidine kinase